MTAILENEHIDHRNHKMHKTCMVPLLSLTLIFCRLASTLAAATTTPDTYNVVKPDTYNVLKSPTTTKPGCPTKCGNLTVPYPFGITTGCALNIDFELNCSTENPPRAFIKNIQIHDISDQHLRVDSTVAQTCYDRTGSVVLENSASYDISATPFTFSDLNKLTVIGCDDLALVTGSGAREFTSSCVSVCSNEGDVVGGDCAGIGGPLI